MRRILAVSALSAALLGLAACSDIDSAASGTSSPSAVVSGAATGGDDKATTCAAYTKLATETKVKFLAATGSLLKSITDPSKQEAAVQELSGVFTELQAGLDQQIASAGDPALKAALSEYAVAVKKTVEDIKAAGPDGDKAMDAVSDDLERLEAGLDTLCK